MLLGPMSRHALFGGRRWGLGPGPEGRPARRLARRLVRRNGGTRCGARTPGVRFCQKQQQQQQGYQQQQKQPQQHHQQDNMLR